MYFGCEIHEKTGTYIRCIFCISDEWQGGIKYAKNGRVWFCLFLHKMRSCKCFMQEMNSIIAII